MRYVDHFNPRKVDQFLATTCSWIINVNEISNTVRRTAWKFLIYVLLQKLADLPLEMLELMLIRAFLMLYPSDVEGDNDRSPVILGKSTSAERRSFRLLSSVCSYWHQTLIGWPESPTSQWVRHQIKRLIERKYTLSYIMHVRITVVVIYT